MTKCSLKNRTAGSCGEMHTYSYYLFLLAWLMLRRGLVFVRSFVYFVDSLNGVGKPFACLARRGVRGIGYI